MDFKFDFDPAGFLNSLRKDSSTESNYLTMTFEEYLKKNNVWDMYKYRLNNTDDARLNAWRKDYEEEMKKRKVKGFPTFILEKKDYSLIEYQGDRSIAAMKEFINKNAS